MNHTTDAYDEDDLEEPTEAEPTDKGDGVGDGDSATPAFWDATDHVRAAMAEALAAERLHSNADVPADVRWLGGHKAAVDVTGVIKKESIAADAKRAFMHPRHPDQLVWMGRKDNSIPEATSHLALVLLDEADSNLCIAQDGTDGADLTITGKIRGTVYLVPREVALTATPALKLDGTVGAGLNVGLPLHAIKAYLLPQGSTSTSTAA